MDAMAKLLADATKCGVFQLNGNARQCAMAAADAGLVVWRIDIGHAHNKSDFLDSLSKVLDFPKTFGKNWDAFADCLRDLSWVEGDGYVIVLEKSKQFCAAHRHEFDEAIGILGEAAEFWKTEGKPFWALVSGPQGWESGIPRLVGI